MQPLSGGEKLTLDPFRIRFSTEFDWAIPDELRNQVELLRAPRVDVQHAPLAERLERALSDPKLEVTLAQLVTPGDRVALAVDPHLPGLLEVLVEMVRELASLNASLAESCIVLPQQATAVAEIIRATLRGEGALGDIQVVLHDAVDRSALAYLAANAAGEPIYVAKALADADVVIPVFAASGQNAFRTEMAARFVHRCFSGEIPSEPNKPTEARKRKTDRAAEMQQQEQDAREAYWQLGAMFGVVVGPGVEGQAGRIVAGSSAELDRAAIASAREWEAPVVAPAGLVIAEVSGGIDQQNWGAAARALETARELCAPAGMIVLLTDVAEGAADRKALRAAQRQAKKGRSAASGDDLASFAAAQGESREGNPVFLRSQLNEETTEEMGMGFVSKPSELNRLIERQARCILIRDAQHVRLSLDAFAAPSPSR